MSATLPPIPEPVSMFAAETIIPAPEWQAWVVDTFVAKGGPLVNHEHEHLRDADVGVLLTNTTCTDKGRTILGRAHIGEPQGSDKWAKRMKSDHLTRLFGEVPDFYLILSAPFIEDRLRENDPAAVCALVEHELYHCAPLTRDGVPLFSKDGRPKWKIRPHDVEEFVGVVRRYGAHSPALRAMRDTLERGPTIARAQLDGVCGTCGANL